jgi:hypothetical protein
MLSFACLCRFQPDFGLDLSGFMVGDRLDRLRAVYGFWFWAQINGITYLLKGYLGHMLLSFFCDFDCLLHKARGHELPTTHFIGIIYTISEAAITQGWE